MRELATRLLSVLPADQPDKIVQFGVNASVSQRIVLCGWPGLWIEVVTEDRPSTPVRWPTGVRAELAQARQGWLGVVVASSQERRLVAADFAEFAPTLVGAWVLWHALRGTAFLIQWRLVRRRYSKGLCMGCGYDLSGLRRGAPD